MAPLNYRCLFGLSWENALVSRKFYNSRRPELCFEQIEEELGIIMSCNTNRGGADKENKQHHLQKVKCQRGGPGRKMSHFCSQFDLQVTSAKNTTPLHFPKIQHNVALQKHQQSAEMTHSGKISLTVHRHTQCLQPTMHLKQTTTKKKPSLLQMLSLA